MKTILVFILLSSSVAFCQRNRPQYYGTVGFGFLFPNTDQINQIINHYNQTKINLYEPFDDFGMIYGPDLEFGVIFDKEKSAIVLEFGFSIKFSSTKSAKNIESNFTRKKIDVSMKFPSLNIGGLYLYKVSKSFDIGAGIYLNLGSISIFTRNYNVGSSPSEYTKIGNNDFLSSVGISPTAYFNIKFSKKISISIRPSYYVMLADQDLSALNSSLNPGYAIAGINSVDFSGPGVALNLTVRLGK